MEGTLHEDMDLYDNISLNYFWNENYFKRCGALGFCDRAS